MNKESTARQDGDSEGLPRSPTILVVDDDAAVCEVIQSALDGSGYRVLVCCDPHEALEVLSREPIDLVLTDLQMGDVSGVDILRAARRYQSDTAVVLITGYPTVENAVQVLKEGAYDYITKPFQLDDLSKVVQHSLEKQRLSREVISLRETVSLYKICQDMNSSLDLTQLLQEILDTAVDEVQSGQGCIILLDERRKRLRVGAARGEPPWDYRQIEQMDPEAVREWIRCHAQLKEPLLLGGEESGSASECRTFEDKVGQRCSLCLPAGEDATSLCVPLRAKDRVVGVLHASRPYRSRRYGDRDLKAAAILASHAARAIENARLYSSLYDDYHSFIEALAQAVEAKDSYSRKHSARVAFYSQVIGHAFRLPITDMEKLEVASLLHDIGKIGISDQILRKPSVLTDEEFEEMRKHPVIGERILKPIESLQEVRKWIYQHHERYDGRGYPEGIGGKAIEFQASILIVAEVYDALTTERAYKKAWSLPATIDYLRQHSGEHFAPDVINKFTEILSRRGDRLAEFVQTSSYRRYSCGDLDEFFADSL